MKKLLVVIAVLGLMVSTATADVVKVVGFDLDYKDSFPSMGVAYYTDEYDDDIAAYIQVTVASLFGDRAFLGFGGLAPLNHFERTRPHFSLHTTLNRLTGGDWWLDPQVGVYGVAGPYKAWGVQLGLAF